MVLVGQGGNMAIGLLSAAVLARILDPTDFGIIAMASAFIVLLGEFADAGLSQATIQRHEINASQVSTLFWVNVAVGAVATLIGVGLAWPIALFYGAVGGNFLSGTHQHHIPYPDIFNRDF